MKKLIIISILAAYSAFSTLSMLTSCETSQAKVGQSETIGACTQIMEEEFKGHLYIIYDGYHSGNIIHAEHCPCKRANH